MDQRKLETGSLGKIPWSGTLGKQLDWRRSTAGILERFSQREKIPQRKFLAVWVWILFPPFLKHKSIKQEKECWVFLRIYGREGWDRECFKILGSS